MTSGYALIVVSLLLAAASPAILLIGGLCALVEKWRPVARQCVATGAALGVVSATSAAVFFAFNAPEEIGLVVLGTAAGAGVTAGAILFLVWRALRLVWRPNNSSKPTPLRGAA